MATKKIKPVATRTVFHVNEDGTSGKADVAVTLTDDCLFRIDLPGYMHYLDGEITRTHVAAEKLIDAIVQYEEVCDEYSRRTLVRNSGKPVLWLGAMLTVPTFAGEAFGIQSLLGLGLQAVVQLPDGKLADTDGVIVGMSGIPAPILLPDTPEVREKIGRLIKSIDTAAEIIGAIRTAADPVAYLLSIPESTVDVSVTQGSSADDPRQIELSLEVASDDNPAPKPPVEDDEEL